MKDDLLKAWRILRPLVKDGYTFSEIKDLAGSSALPIEELTHLQQKSLPAKSATKSQLLDAIDDLICREEQPEDSIRLLISFVWKGNPELREEIVDRLKEQGITIEDGEVVSEIRSKSTQTMKRDRELQVQMLLDLRNGTQQVDPSQYESEHLAYNAALILDEGLAEGDSVKNHRGRYASAVLTHLTGKGHDFLDALDEDGPEPQQLATPMKVFVSHSSDDAILAEAIVELLRAALSIPASQIRCTSVPEYGLDVGDNTDARLKAEVRESKCFIALITPVSIGSTYVLFELGARWGTELPLFPVLGRGATSRNLDGPLKAINAISLTDVSRIHHLINKVGSVLELTLAETETFARKVEAVREAAKDTIQVEPSLGAHPRLWRTHLRG
tara:strand:+ start:1750 stop:2910 length:1161 start_codon:yes stop_codon:yes gene_type:complete